MTSQTKEIHYKDLCRQMIKGSLEHRYDTITSWLDFFWLEDEKIIPDGIPQWKKLRAMAFGIKQGWLEPEWFGVTNPPFATGIKRQRIYFITEKGKKAVLEDS